MIICVAVYARSLCISPYLAAKLKVSYVSSFNRVGIVFCGRQSPGGHNVVWGLLNGLKIHNSRSTLLGFLGELHLVYWILDFFLFVFGGWINMLICFNMSYATWIQICLYSNCCREWISFCHGRWHLIGSFLHCVQVVLKVYLLRKLLRLLTTYLQPTRTKVGSIRMKLLMFWYEIVSGL